MGAVLGFAYRKLGRFYPATFLTLELQTAFGVTVGTIALYSLYYEAFADEYVPIGAIALALTAVAVALNLLRTYPLLRPIQRWIAGERSPEATARAWSAAVGIPVELIRRDFWIPTFVVVFPAIVATIIIVGLSWLAFFPLFSGAMIAVGYGAILHYLALEQGMRPVLLDINSQLAPRLQADVSAIPLRVRLMVALPLITVITGFVVAALTSEGNQVRPEADFMIAIAVASAVALELTVLLSKSILRPIADLQEATEAIGRGDYTVSVPVTTGDEIGELAASFNQMVEGLRERERIREAFGTYLDQEVAEYILSEGFSEEGVEVDVSIVFVDVVDFTSFAARADARQVVACLNELFEVVVPIISRHGGHIDKFVGDGVLAVFGAPEPFPDHADRAVRAAIEMARRVNDGVAGDLRIGIGINSGRVVAGSIGGAGRLNFSVIGDAVNVASRVEACTRETGDELLITADTRERMSAEIEVEDRGARELKGVAKSIEVYAPVIRGAVEMTGEAFPVPGGTLAGDGDSRTRSGEGTRAEAPG